jgi:hypothetical protein
VVAGVVLYVAGHLGRDQLAEDLGTDTFAGLQRHGQQFNVSLRLRRLSADPDPAGPGITTTMPGHYDDHRR